MTDTPPGHGWWKASDGEWYPPEQHPDYVPPHAPTSNRIERGVSRPPTPEPKPSNLKWWLGISVGLLIVVGISNALKGEGDNDSEPQERTDTGQTDSSSDVPDGAQQIAIDRIGRLTDCAEVQDEFDIASDNADRAGTFSQQAKVSRFYLNLAYERGNELGCPAFP